MKLGEDVVHLFVQKPIELLLLHRLKALLVVTVASELDQHQQYAPEPGSRRFLRQSCRLSVRGTSEEQYWTASQGPRTREEGAHELSLSALGPGERSESLSRYLSLL